MFNVPFPYTHLIMSSSRVSQFIINNPILNCYLDNSLSVYIFLKMISKIYL